MSDKNRKHYIKKQKRQAKGRIDKKHQGFNKMRSHQKLNLLHTIHFDNEEHIHV